MEHASVSAKDLKRPGLQEPLRVLESGDASALVVAKLDRLSRSMIDFTALMGRALKQEWALVALDCAVDTTTPAGEAMANMLDLSRRYPRHTPNRIIGTDRVGRLQRVAKNVGQGLSQAREGRA
jgi:DNA invertase Pin-like site-specific DNA recombinase